MADVYWIDVTGVASWDDNTLGVTPWGSASGVADNAPNPVDGDRVFFDANSTAAPVAGPVATVSLALLDMSGCPVTLPTLANVVIAAAGGLICTQATVFTGSFAASVSSTGVFNDSSQFTGAAGAGVSLAFNTTATCGGAASFLGANQLIFNDSSSNSSTTFTGSGHAISFTDTSVNNAAFSVTGNVSFSDNSTNGANITATGNVSIPGGGVANNANITATAISVPGTVTGGGSLIGPVAVTGMCSVAVTGNVTITAGGSCGAVVTGNVNVSGGGSLFSGTCSGTCTLAASGGSTGVVDTLVTPYTTGAGKWGTFTHLTQTGIPSGINGSGILGMA